MILLPAGGDFARRKRKEMKLGAKMQDAGKQ
jgi:hypothetical protein